MAEIWAAAAVVVGAGISAYSSSRSANKQRDSEKLNSELGFQREAWLQERDRKFQLENRRYTEDNIAGFRQFAPESARTFNGQPIAPPTMTDTSGLANFDPNVSGSLNNRDPKANPLMPSGAMYG